MTQPSHKWRSTINARLEIDRLSTNPKFKSRGNSTWLIRQIWKKVLDYEENLPEDWTRESGVLVGIRVGIG